MGKIIFVEEEQRYYEAEHDVWAARDPAAIEGRGRIYRYANWQDVAINNPTLRYCDDGRDINPPIPETYDEAVALLVKQLSVEDRTVLRTMRHEDLGALHFSWGMSLRNDFDLWRVDSPLIRSYAERKGWGDDEFWRSSAPEFISGDLILSVWEAVQAADGEGAERGEG
jgi:hypothetical protein